MSRKIYRVEGLREILPLTQNQIYKLVRHPVHPLPHKKVGKLLLFDEARVLKWFEGLPGRDVDDISK